MKKIFIFFLSLMGLGFPAFAQSHINIEMLSATYTTPAVQFRVSWNSIPAVAGQTHNAKIWLWVDFIKIENNQPSGMWTRATVADPSPGTVAPETNKGFWLQGSSGSYNQIVTVTLTNIPTDTEFNWCVYASDCPPNVTATNGTYTFNGTPPFTLIASDGTTIQTISGGTLAVSALTITPVTITDQTECPGVFCPYQGSDLYIDATHLCQLRTSGAQNWEAWIKDTRDDEYYRIVLMPDNKWWLAQNVKLASYGGSAVGSAISGCTADECGRKYTQANIYASYAGGSSSSTGNVQGICPPGWLLPVTADWMMMIAPIGDMQTIAERLRALNSGCSPRTDYYGFADIKGTVSGTLYASYTEWYANDHAREDGLVIDFACWGNNQKCGYVLLFWDGSNDPATVRCFRQL
jgi:uncharacterized protein (TIGR02145 family)